MIGWAMIALLGAWASARVVSAEKQRADAAEAERRAAELGISRVVRSVGNAANPLAVNLSTFLPKRGGG